jgi:tetratricopeptide (TPR) repeat protein
VELLKKLGVTGAQREFETLVEEVRGHALTLNLLGGFLKRAHRGDIRRRDRVKFEKADGKILGGHAFRAMAAYEQWLLSGGEEGRREVTVLRLMGLFDRPADAACLQALRSETIPGLNEPIVGLEDDDWEFILSGLKDAKLLTVNRDGSGALLALDAHPLLREYFAKALREQNPEAWRAAHRRLYEHLCETTEDKPKPTLEDLQPLYQEVAHGCLAGMQQEACDEVYFNRIVRREEFYSIDKLGALGSDLGAIACFFEQPWSRVSPALTEADQSWLLNEAASRLRALGRLTEVLDPMRTALEMKVKQEDWKNTAVAACNLSELELTLGEVTLAVEDAERSVTYAERSGDTFERMSDRATHANALLQAGRRGEAETRFREAEEMQAERQPEYPLLYSQGSFLYCDLLLAAAERTAWRRMLIFSRDHQPSPLPESCRAVSERAARTLQWAERGNLSLRTIALGHLTLGRAALYAAVLEGKPLDQLDPCRKSLQRAVDGLRRAGTQDHLPLGLLTRAWLRFLTGARTGPESAQSDLDEAWEIAERGPMPLFMADIHLHRARLFGLSKDRPANYPWTSPKADLAEARRLIEKHGYWRRKEELEDAEAAARAVPDTP